MRSCSVAHSARGQFHSTIRSLGRCSRTLLMISIALVAVSGCDRISSYLSSPKDILLKPRLEAQWQSIDVTNRAMAGRTTLAAWSGGAFVGASALGAALSQLDGYQLEYVPTDGWLAGTSIQVQSIQLTPDIGYAGAEIILRATRGKAAIDLKVSAIVSYMGVSRADGKSGEDTVQAQFRLDPLEISTKTTLGPFEFQLKDFWSRLAPDLAVAFADPNLFNVTLPLKDRFKLMLGIDRTATETVDKKTGATITYRVTMPPTTIEEKISYAAPIFRPEGIWLLGRSAEEGQDVVQPAQPPALAQRDLAAEIGKMQTSLAASTSAFTGDTDTVSVWINQSILVKAVADFSGIPDSGRQINVQTTAYTGHLDEEKWSDKFLGDGGYYAELASADGGHVMLQIGKPTSGWDGGALVAALPLHASINAAVAVHFDPLIGGGVGTSIGLVGSGDGTIKAAFLPSVLTSQDAAVAVLKTKLSCDAVSASIASDGKLKIDLGWISVPSIGAKMVMPIGRNQIGAAALFDNKPIFVELPASDPRTEADLAKRQAMIAKSPWAKVPPVPAITVRVVPRSITGTQAGYTIVAAIEAQPLAIERTPAALSIAKAAVEKEAEELDVKVDNLLKSQQPEPTCTGDTTIAVLLGPVEIGPNNEVVKWARNSWSDLTHGPGPSNDLVKAKAAAERALAPVTPYIAIGKHNGGLGVQIGRVKF